MVAFLETPAQEPFEKSELFPYGAVPHVLFIAQEIYIFIQSELVEIFKGNILLKLFNVGFYGCELFVGRFSPVILVAAFLDKLIEHLPKAYSNIFLLFSVRVFHSQVKRIL